MRRIVCCALDEVVPCIGDPVWCSGYDGLFCHSIVVLRGPRLMPFDGIRLTPFDGIRLKPFDGTRLKPCDGTRM